MRWSGQAHDCLLREPPCECAGVHVAAHSNNGRDGFQLVENALPANIASMDDAFDTRHHRLRGRREAACVSEMTR